MVVCFAVLPKITLAQQSLVCEPVGDRWNTDSIRITNYKNHATSVAFMQHVCDNEGQFVSEGPYAGECQLQHSGSNPKTYHFSVCLNPGESRVVTLPVISGKVATFKAYEHRSECERYGDTYCGCYQTNRTALWDRWYDYNGNYYQGKITTKKWGTVSNYVPIGCDNSQVFMSSNTPVRLGENITFSISGCTGYNWLGDTFTGGISDTSGVPWNATTSRQTTSAGNFSWTHSWKECRPVHTDSGGLPAGCNNCAKTLNYTISNAVNDPKRCSVSVSSSTMASGGSTVVTVSGTGNLLGEPVRLFVEKSDGSLVPGLGTAYQSAEGNYYHELGTCTYSQTGVPCTITRTVSNLPLGTYYTHCDLPTNPPNPGPLALRCSGNPFCPPPPGIGLVGMVTRDNCDGWLSCSADDVKSFSVVNSVPSTVAFRIQRPSTGTVVPAEGSGNNHVCQQEEFIDGSGNERRMRLAVDASDADGANNISQVEVRMVAGSYSVTLVGTVSGSNMSIGINNVSAPGVTTYGAGIVENINTTTRRFIFPIQYAEVMANRTYAISYRVKDINNAWSNGGSWTSSGRNMKVWDCNVPVSGSLYDQAGAEGVCPNSNLYTNLFATSYALTYQGIGTPSKLMNVTATANPQYTSESNPLKWGKQYQAVFGSIEGSPPTGPRFDDLGRVGENIPCNMTFTINNSVVDPYSANTSLRVDYSSLRNQPPWYQVEGGGVAGVGGVVSKVPVTCIGLSCTPYFSVSTANCSSGLVAGQPLSGAVAGRTYYSQTSNWHVSEKDVVDGSYGYDFFHSRYHVRMGKGVVISGNAKTSEVFGLISMDTMALQSFAMLGGTVQMEVQGDGTSQAVASEIVFVDGDLIIDHDVDLPDGRFILIVVKGNITIEPIVTKVEGVYITDSTISAGGTNNTQLIIEGILLAKGGVGINRGYGNPVSNNTSPAVVVRYNPMYVFGMSKDIKEAVSWYYGD